MHNKIFLSPARLRSVLSFEQRFRWPGAKSQILGAGSQDDAGLLRRILDRLGLSVGARKSF
jgi:hypothetical protein